MAACSLTRSLHNRLLAAAGFAAAADLVQHRRAELKLLRPAEPHARRSACLRVPPRGVNRGDAVLGCEDEEYDKMWVHEEDFTPAMMAVVGKVDFNRILEEASFVFEGLDPETVSRLVELAGTKVFAAKGSCLMKQGVTNPYVIILGSGHCAVDINGNHVAYIIPGQLIGEFAFVRKQPAVASVRVLSDMAYFLVLDHSTLADILKDNQEVHSKINTLLHQRELQNKAASFLR